MIRAKITKKGGYQCAPEGHTVVTIPFGEIVTGKVAGWALAAHAASRMFDPREETKVEAAPEVKKKRGRRKKKVDD